MSRVLLLDPADVEIAEALERSRQLFDGEDNTVPEASTVRDESSDVAPFQSG